MTAKSIVAASHTSPDTMRRAGSSSTPDYVENGVFQPSTLLALKLARALGRPVESLFWIVD
jgi:hypothetical protein